MKKKLDFDFIILGTLPAGICLVLLFEAGPLDKKLFNHMPVGVYRVLRERWLNWN